jgi:hypothetical protein
MLDRKHTFISAQSGVARNAVIMLKTADGLLIS